MNRADFLNTLAVVSVASSGALSMRSKFIAGILVPDTDLANEATSLAMSCEPIEIFNHSLRTFLFSQLIARTKKIAHDIELVYVASILHDTGLSSKYMSDSRPFEVDGANVLRELLTKREVADSRINLAWDAVALHDNGGIAQQKQPEVQLVNSGVNADFGAYLDTMTKDQIVDILSAAPRTNFIDIFVNAAATVAKKKPLVCAHSFVADIGYCKVPGFHLPSFCDGLGEDPFAAYELRS
jgi:HD domain